MLLFEEVRHIWLKAWNYAFAYNEGRLEKGSNFQRGPLSFLVSCFCLGFRLDQ